MSTTVTVITTSALVSPGTSATLSLIAIVTLLFLLISKEIFITASTVKGQAFERALNFAIVPLMMVIGVVLAMKLTESLR